MERMKEKFLKNCKNKEKLNCKEIEKELIDRNVWEEEY